MREYEKLIIVKKNGIIMKTKTLLLSNKLSKAINVNEINRETCFSDKPLSHTRLKCMFVESFAHKID